MSIYNPENYLLSKAEATKDFPFNPHTAVYKVCGKMFALVWVEHGHFHINLKCDPEEAIELRCVFRCVLPGYHMNKKHWNTVIIDGSLPAAELQRMMDNSYRLVINGLSKKVRLGLNMRNESAVL